jgi:hypothetical protein
MGLANHDLPPPPSGKYPAKAHARRVAEFIAENGGPKDGVIYLEAQKTAMVEVWSMLLVLCSGEVGWMVKIFVIEEQRECVVWSFADNGWN